MPRALWTTLWIALSAGLAQLLSFVVHERGFALGYGSDYTLQGDLVRASRAREWVFRPRFEPGQVTVQILPRTNDGLESESLRACRRGGHTCRFATEVRVLGQGRFRLEFNRTLQGNTQVWVAYGAEVNGVLVLTYLEGTSRVGLLEHFWNNSRLEPR
ncbi:MAG: hypothetical protein SFU83_15260 [Meiothermus sp.]|nr:hypothetical protein [Meiothermus sp.]